MTDTTEQAVYYFSTTEDIIIEINAMAVTWNGVIGAAEVTTLDSGEGSSSGTIDNTVVGGQTSNSSVAYNFEKAISEVKDFDVYAYTPFDVFFNSDDTPNILEAFNLIEGNSFCNLIFSDFNYYKFRYQLLNSFDSIDSDLICPSLVACLEKIKMLRTESNGIAIAAQSTISAALAAFDLAKTSEEEAARGSEADGETKDIYQEYSAYFENYAYWRDNEGVFTSAGIEWHHSRRYFNEIYDKIAYLLPNGNAPMPEASAETSGVLNAEAGLEDARDAARAAALNIANKVIEIIKQTLGVARERIQTIKSLIQEWLDLGHETLLEVSFALHVNGFNLCQIAPNGISFFDKLLTLKEHIKKYSEKTMNTMYLILEVQSEHPEVAPAEENRYIKESVFVQMGILEKSNSLCARLEEALAPPDFYAGGALS